MTTVRDFPGAPEDATVSEEGWLLIGDEAWTLQEWCTTSREDRPRTAIGPFRHPTEEDRRAAIRAARQRYNTRRRADPAYRAHEAELTRRRRSTAVNP